MANVSKPNTFTANTTISSSQVNDNFDTIYNEFNGNISGANLAAGAVTSSKIADTVEIANLEITDSLTISGNQTAAGWDPIGGTLSVATGYNDGNKSFEIDSSTDLTSTLSPGMRFSTNTSGFTIPTQCTDLEASSSQYWSKSSPSGITFTDDFTCEAWIKLESYAAGGIVSRRDSDVAGWSFAVESDGRLSLVGLRIASNNRTISSYQSIPLGRWVHVAATMDNSANTHTMYIDGVSVPFNTVTGGTITAIVQPSVNLMVGNRDDDNDAFFDGEIAEVRVWSAIRTATEIQDNMCKVLTGSETNLVYYDQFNGSSNDLTANNNDMTASGGATATTADNPFNLNSGKHYGIITKVTSTKITVFTGTDSFIPNATLTTPQYSTQKVPFGFPVGRDKWTITTISSGASNTTSTSFASLIEAILVPLGAWRVVCNYYIEANFGSTTTGKSATISISSSGTTETNPQLSATAVMYDSTSANHGTGGNLLVEENMLLASATTFTVIGKTASGTLYFNVGGLSTTRNSYFEIESAYL